MKPEVVSEILNSPGHWRVNFRPDTFEKNKFDHSQIRALLQKHQIALRGWNFPHFKEDKLTNHPGFVESITNAQVLSVKREFFRFYKSGQFIYHAVLREDDPETKKRKGIEKGLELTNTIWTLTEFFEFCRRLSSDGVFGKEVKIDIQLRGALNRSLYTNNFDIDLFDDYKCHSAYIPVVDQNFKVSDILGASNNFAIKAVQEVLSLFNNSVTQKPLLEEEQRRLFERRF